MRGANQNFKKKASNLEDHVRESDLILNRIGQIKESASPYLSNTKMSDGQREKWFQYLPNQNANNNYHASVSRQENRNDNYLHSLERRLQKLFREEKEMLKERHYKNEQNVSSYQTRNKRSITNHQINQEREFEASYNIEHMDRKIRQLEQRYRQQDIHKKEKPQQKESDAAIDQLKRFNRREESIQRKVNTLNDKINYEYSPTYNQNLLTQSVQQCVNRQKYLEVEVESLKKSVKELHENNEELFKRIQKKDEKKKHKYRTKQLLQNILHKLQFINVEIRSAKKREERHSDGKASKIQKDTSEILQQFELLRLQYKHLEGQKLKFEKKQQEIEKKLQTITEKKPEEKQ